MDIRNAPLDYISAQLEAWEVTADSEPPRYGRPASGYGSKIPTRYRVHFVWNSPVGKRVATRRVYASCYSDVATFYIVINNGRVLMNATEDLELGYHHIGAGNSHTITAPSCDRSQH